MIPLVSYLFNNLRPAIIFLLIGAVVGGVSTWKLFNWRGNNREVADLNKDYAIISQEFYEYRLEAQKKIDQYNKTLTDQIKSYRELQARQDGLFKDKEMQMLSIQEEMNGLRKSLPKLSSVACKLDIDHQRVLERITKTANYPTIKSPSTTTTTFATN